MELREALEAATVGVARADLAAAVERLTTRYRAGGAARVPILASTTDVTAYAAYRMPATYAAVRAALARLPVGLAPKSHVDIGGGTGAAAWAAADAFPSIDDTTVVDQVAAALQLGQRLAANHATVRTARWRRGTVDDPVPEADLITVSYVLGELSDVDQASLVARAGAAAGTLVLVEPGTPAGYERILAARSALLAAGHRVLAPCPHDDACPLPRGRDWCHFSVRVARSSLHRWLKDGDLSFEDEKFSYVATTRIPGPPPPSARILRHPQQRKGLVSLRLCTRETATTTVISKRQGDHYRAARDARWGDPWPPV